VNFIYQHISLVSLYCTVCFDCRVESLALVTEVLWASCIRGAVFTWHQVQIGKVMIQGGA